MKILKTDSFVSERIKVKPITNAELDKAQKEFENSTLKELPLEYETIFVVGNVLTIKSLENVWDPEKPGDIYDYIVVTDDNHIFRRLNKINSPLLVRYKETGPTRISYWSYYEAAFKPSTFPKSGSNSHEIINIKGTIPKEELDSVKDLDYLKKLYDKYHLIYQK